MLSRGKGYLVNIFFETKEHGLRFEVSDAAATKGIVMRHHTLS